MVTKKEKKDIDKMFKALDTNGDGKLSKDELETGLLNYYGTKLTQDELLETFKKCDSDGNGFFDYSEFVLAAMDQRVILDKKKLESVFRKLDIDKSGTIEVNEISEMFKYHNLSAKQIDRIMKEVD